MFAVLTVAYALFRTAHAKTTDTQTSHVRQGGGGGADLPRQSRPRHHICHSPCARDTALHTCLMSGLEHT